MKLLAWLFCCGWLSGVLGIAACKITDTPEPPLAAAPVVGTVDQATAQRNREWIEAFPPNSLIQLPAGLIVVDQAPGCKTGWTIQGMGANRTTIRNDFARAPFGSNCSLQILQGLDFGIGYADWIKLSPVEPTTATLTDQSAAVHYPVDSLCWSWKWNGYADSLGAPTRVRLHKITGVRGQRLTLDSPPDPQATAIVWARSALKLTSAAEGQLTVVYAGKPTPDWAVGRFVRLTGGPTIANECVGEIRRIVGLDLQRITLDRPLRKSYGPTAAIVLYSPVENVTIRDLTVAAPTNVDAPPFFAEHTVGLTLERCRFEGQGPQVANSANIRIVGCESADTLGGNDCHDMLIRDCRTKHVYFEEGNSDVDVENTLVSGSPRAGVISNGYAPSERLRFRNVVIEAAHNMPIALSGRECVIENVRVSGSQPDVPSDVANYLGGDSLRVHGFTSDLQTVILAGRGISLNSMRGPVTLGWVTGDQPIGKAFDCDQLNSQYLTAATKGQWSFVASPVVSLVQGTERRAAPKHEANLRMVRPAPESR